VKEINDKTPDVIADNIDFCMVNIEHPDCTLDLAGRFYEEMTTNLRAMAISYLLLHADTDAFYAELTISAQARRHYLTRCVKGRYSDFYGACSRWDPFFDALAARNAAIAHDIASLSPADWLDGAEYEDDYCYARFLHRYIANDATRVELQALLDRFESALEGAPSSRLALCKSLLARDQKAFDKAFEDLLADREAEIDEERSGIAAEEVCAALGTYLFVEGLGVLWVAENAGFKTLREYPLCPALARMRMMEPAPADAFPPV
jgi:hypothetical protein